MKIIICIRLHVSHKNSPPGKRMQLVLLQETVSNMRHFDMDTDYKRFLLMVKIGLE